MKIKNLSVRRGTTAQRRWMIVDDNEDILRLMQGLIRNCFGVQIECFHSPLAARDAVAAAPDAFELVITDLEMPGMSGIELCRSLRELSPSLKVLLSTGSDILTEEEAVEKGFCGLVRKPFPFAVLRHALAAAGVGKMFLNSFARQPVLATV